jgi:hypothetical protein
MKKKQNIKTTAGGEALSPVEAAYLEDTIRLMGQAPDLSHLRDLIKSIAYHEAGHVIGRMFTGQDTAHITLVGIIPDQANMGRVRTERNFTEMFLDSRPAPLKRQDGRCLLLGLLAGEAAQARVDGFNPGWLEEEMSLRESDTWEDEGTDFFRAERIAEIMAGPKNPPHVVLRWAARWTEEMIALPKVWATVETFAGLLIERGEISDPEEIFRLCDGICGEAYKSPKWRRRLFPSKAEMQSLRG